ncbi:MAG: class I tRNA ligase family protein, partial [Acidobacteria bacterium]|nr:class I tRNA ligase family protein [Acidobacteriota bacterium]
KVGPLAEAAIRAVEEGRTRFTPENWTKIYFDWLRTVHDRCISRQLWWGHRIPAWYCGSCGKTTVSKQDPSHCAHCGKATLTQDPDVLDTWFSSALWPFSTLGWPEQTRDLKVFYPTSLMITGFDILFFWVARMMMMGMEFMGDVPFREVYIHQLVRDADKQKMSKTKGNVIDPLAVTEKFGTDAVRFTLAIMSSPGTDIALSEDRMEGYRAFANKIWNAARFVIMSMEKAGAPAWAPPSDITFAAVPEADGEIALEDRWIFSRLSQLAREMAKAWDTYRYHEAADLIYHFFWHEFCDWYLELKKLRFDAVAANPATMPPAFENLCRAFDVALRLLHPMMPFITEELWQRLASRDGSIALAQFPKHDTSLLDDDAEREMALLQDIIVNIRNLRAELKVDAKRKIPVEMHAANGAVAQLGSGNREAIERLANLSALRMTTQPLQEEGGALRALPDYSLKIALADAVDFDSERARLKKEQQKLEQELATLARQLDNEQFLAKAPAQVVANLRARREEVAAQLAKAQETLRKIG